MPKIQGFELPMVNIKKGKHTMDVPRQCIPLLRKLFYYAGFKAGSIVDVELGPKIESSNTTPIFTVGQITERRSVELNVKSNGNDSRYLFYVFPTGEINLFNFHINLKNAVDAFNCENSPGYKSKTNLLATIQSQKQPSSLKVPMADLVFKNLQKKLKPYASPSQGTVRPEHKREQVIPVKSDPIEVKKAEVVQVQSPVTKVEAPVPVQIPVQVEQKSATAILQDEEILTVLLECLYEKSHERTITRANMLHVIEKQKLGCNPDNVEAFLIRKKYIERKSSSRGTFKFNYTPLKKVTPKVEEVEDDELVNVDSVTKLRDESDRYFKLSQELGGVDDEIKRLKDELLKLQERRNNTEEIMIKFKPSFDKFNKLKKLFLEQLK